MDRSALGLRVDACRRRILTRLQAADAEKAAQIAADDIDYDGVSRTAILGRLPAQRFGTRAIAVAGMEGALFSVLAGLVAVPSSVGYGAGAGGTAVLSAMLCACASGVLTVNIDNGFGAAATAAKILSLGSDRTE